MRKKTTDRCVITEPADVALTRAMVGSGIGSQPNPRLELLGRRAIYSPRMRGRPR